MSEMSPLAEGRELKFRHRAVHAVNGSPLAEGRELKYTALRRCRSATPSPLAEGRELK